QVLRSRWFDRTRGRAMGIAYLGIGIGGAIVPLLANRLTEQFGWRGSLQALGVIMVLIALPLAYLVKDQPPERGGSGAEQARPLQDSRGVSPHVGAELAPPAAATEARPLRDVLSQPAFYLLAI